MEFVLVVPVLVFFQILIRFWLSVKRFMGNSQNFITLIISLNLNNLTLHRVCHFFFENYSIQKNETHVIGLVRSSPIICYLHCNCKLCRKTFLHLCIIPTPRFFRQNSLYSIRSLKLYAIKLSTLLNNLPLLTICAIYI